MITDIMDSNCKAMSWFRELQEKSKHAKQANAEVAALLPSGGSMEADAAQRASKFKSKLEAAAVEAQRGTRLSAIQGGGAPFKFEMEAMAAAATAAAGGAVAAALAAARYIARVTDSGPVGGDEHTAANPTSALIDAKHPVSVWAHDLVTRTLPKIGTDDKLQGLVDRDVWPSPIKRVPDAMVRAHHFSTIIISVRNLK